MRLTCPLRRTVFIVTFLPWYRLDPFLLLKLLFITSYGTTREGASGMLLNWIEAANC
jgi:hypothetical protein